MVKYENDELEQDCEEGQEAASLLEDNGDISPRDVPQKRESSSDDESTSRTRRQQIGLSLLAVGLAIFLLGFSLGRYFSPQSSSLANVNLPSLNDVPPPSADLASQSKNQDNHDHDAVVSENADSAGTSELTDETSAEENPSKSADTTEAKDDSSSPKDNQGKQDNGAVVSESADSTGANELKDETSAEEIPLKSTDTTEAKDSSSPKEENTSKTAGEAPETELMTSPNKVSIMSESSSPTAIDESLFVPHVPFGHDLHYHRVCALVHSSILCMIMRFPFPVLE